MNFMKYQLSYKFIVTFDSFILLICIHAYRYNNQAGRTRWGTSSSSAAGSNALGVRTRSDGRKCGAPNDCGDNCGGCCGSGFCLAEKGSRVRLFNRY